MSSKIISSYAKNIIRWNEPLDIYTNKVLLHKNKTIEHIVPKTLFRNTPYHSDIFNLCVTTSRINNLRDSFKYSDLEMTHNKNIKPIIIDDSPVAYYNSDKRLFYPILNKGRIARICQYISNKYSIHPKKIFENDDVFLHWLSYPIDINECFATTNKIRLIKNSWFR
jgi:endonuclease I